MYGLGLLKGLAVTIKYAFKKPFTVQYPEVRIKTQPRYRGYEFVWYEDRCTGCASCAKYCPLGIIKIVTKVGQEPNIGGKFDLEVFDIDTGRCMFCALCVEACPYDALFMGTNYERASYTRGGMVIHIDELRNAKKMPSAFLRPNLEEKAGQYSPSTSLNANEAGR
jgi:NADH-quinone oxidoreductase subunit I